MNAEKALKTVLIGIGNEFRGDDGLGILVARNLRPHLEPQVPIIESDGDVTELLELFKMNDRVFIVDALQSLEFPPGTLVELNAVESELPPGLSGTSTHAFGLEQAIELAKNLSSLPAEIVVFAIEGQNFDFESKLSGPIQENLENISRTILKRIQNKGPTHA